MGGCFQQSVLGVISCSWMPWNRRSRDARDICFRNVRWPSKWENTLDYKHKYNHIWSFCPSDASCGGLVGWAGYSVHGVQYCSITPLHIHRRLSGRSIVMVWLISNIIVIIYLNIFINFTITIFCTPLFVPSPKLCVWTCLLWLPQQRAAAGDLSWLARSIQLSLCCITSQ